MLLEPDDAGFVAPAYGRRALSDVVPAIAAALGLPIGPAPTDLELPPAGSYVLFLVDGLGSLQLEKHAHAAPYLSSLLRASAPGTAGVPSTTATSLTSLATALPPGGHGLVGYTARVPGTEALLNHLQWDVDVDPLAYQPHPTALAALEAAGAQVTTVNKRAFRTSGLTRASQPGTTYVAADTPEDRIAAALAASAARPSLTYLYDSALDGTGHQWGVASGQWLRRLAEIDDHLEQLREALPVDRRLVVVADHGMVDGPAAHQVDVDTHPELRDGLALLGGEARFRHLYCREGAAEDVRATWTAFLGARAEVLTRAEAVARGWFGPVEDRVLPRLGDVVVACREDHTVMASRQFPHETTLVGLHGSLTPDEMLVPIAVD